MDKIEWWSWNDKDAVSELVAVCWILCQKIKVLEQKLEENSTITD